MHMPAQFKKTASSRFTWRASSLAETIREHNLSWSGSWALLRALFLLPKAHLIRRVRIIRNQLGPVELQPVRVPVATRATPLLRQDQDAASRYGVHGRSDSEDECKLGALKE